jgi:hypothetical protein
MTRENMARYAGNPAYPFWKTLKEGYDYFELTHQLPTVAVCNRSYVVNVAMRGGDPSRLDPQAACPAFFRPKPDPFRPKPGEQLAEQIIVPGPKMRTVASFENNNATRSGLMTTGSTSLFGSGQVPRMSFGPAQ